MACANYFRTESSTIAQRREIAARFSVFPEKRKVVRGGAFMKVRAMLAAVLSVAATTLLAAPEANYDLVIRGGRIVDGTGNPWFYGDLAVNADRIAALGQVAGDAKRVIDATGLVVAPGFIDMHSHSDWVLLEDGNAQSKIRQGVTTEIIGESSSAGPFKGKLKPRSVSVKNTSTEITTLRDYFAAVERAGISVNIASYVGQGTIWECVMGSSFERPSPGEFKQMKQ